MCSTYKAPDLRDKWLSNNLAKCNCWNALLGMPTAVPNCALTQAGTQNGHYWPSHINSTFKGTQILLRHFQKQNISISPSYTGILLQLQGFLVVLKDSVVQAAPPELKAHSHIWADLAHLNWAVTAQRVPNPPSCRELLPLWQSSNQRVPPLSCSCT